MKMKKQTLIILILFGFSVTAYAQESEKSNGMVYGFQLGQYQKDFGFGLNITSPLFVHDNIALRLRGNLMFNEHPENNETQWTPYSNVSLGIMSGRTKLGDYLAVYGEGGVIGLFPSDEFSTEDFVFGGYGIFGFEFLIDDHVNYFIELGGVGTGAEADQIPNAPIYSNGFLINVGFRVTFSD